MAGKIVKTLGFLVGLGAGIAGYQEANAQELYNQIPENRIKYLNPSVKNRVNNLGKKDLEIMTVDEYKKLPVSEIPRYDSYIWTSPDGKTLGPSLYASKDIWNSLAPEDKLYLKRAAVKPSWYLTTTDMKKRIPVYEIKEGNDKYLVFGSAEAVAESPKPTSQQKSKAKSSAYSPKAKAKKFGKKTITPRQETKQPSKLEEEAKKAQARKDTLKGTEETKYEEEKYAPGLDTSKVDTSYAVPAKTDTAKIDTAKINVYEGIKDTSVVAGLDTSYVSDKEIDELRTRYGLNAFVGTNSEYGLGASINFPITPWLSVEGFANWYASHLRNDNGLPVSSGSSSNVTLREVQQAGTKYKYRTENLTTKTEDHVAADIGAGLTFRIPDWNVEFPLKAGVNFSNRHETLNRTDNIRFEENTQTLEEHLISNSKPGKRSLELHPTMSAGARYNITKNLSVGAEFNRTGKTNSARFNMGVRF